MKECNEDYLVTKILESLAELSSEQKMRLRDGEATLVYKRIVATKPKKAKGVNKEYPFTVFDSCETEEQLKKILEDSAYSKVQLQEIAKRYCCPAISKSSKSQLIQNIAWQAVGSKKFHQALYDSYQKPK